MESHQLETSSLYRDYKELKCNEVEVKSLKRAHREREETLTMSQSALQQEMIEMELLRKRETEQSAAKVCSPDDDFIYCELDEGDGTEAEA